MAGGSVFLVENLVVASVNAVALVTGKGRILILVLCSLLSLHWLGVFLTAWGTFRFWRMGLTPALLSTMVLPFIALNLWTLTRRQLTSAATNLPT